MGARWSDQVARLRFDVDMHICFSLSVVSLMQKFGNARTKATNFKVNLLLSDQG